MTAIFLTVFNLSITAGWLVLGVLVLRLLFKKAPKWITVLLWGIVGIRLVFPFSIESVLSLIPSSQTVPVNIATSPTPSIDSGVPIINNTINPIIADNFTPQAENSANPLQVVVFALSVLWLVGIAAMLVYTALSYIRVQQRVKTAVLLRDNIYQCETVNSPFVLGIIKPGIYLPFDISDKNRDYVIAHEHAHLVRRDHIWKPLGFLILTVYWFNPILWLAYILLCRDIELACDERVIMGLDRPQRADYSEALLACSVNRRVIAACPLAFGEVGVKQRIKGVLSYNKPALWVVVLAFAAIILTSMCGLTAPPTKNISTASLLSDLTGAEDLNKIEGFQIIHKYGGIATAITETADIDFLKEYHYKGDYPMDKLHELFVFPKNQLIKVELGEGKHKTMYLTENGDITLENINGQKTEYKIYTAEDECMLDQEALIELLKKYGGYKQ